MRENRTYGSEGGAAETNRPSLPLFTVGMEAGNWGVMGGSTGHVSPARASAGCFWGDSGLRGVRPPAQDGGRLTMQDGG